MKLLHIGKSNRTGIGSVVWVSVLLHGYRQRHYFIHVELRPVRFNWNQHDLNYQIVIVGTNREDYAHTTWKRWFIKAFVGTKDSDRTADQSNLIWSIL